MNQQIQNYIIQSKTQGKSNEQIKQELSNAGWPQAEVDDNFKPIITDFNSVIAPNQENRRDASVLLIILDRFFNYLLLISFAGILISAFFYQHLLVGVHNFNVPAVCFLLVGISLFFSLILKLILKDKSNMKYVSDPKKTTIVGMIVSLGFICFGAYVFYTSLTSVYLAKFNPIFDQGIATTSVQASSGVKLFYEIDSNTDEKGAQYKVTVSNGSWSSTEIFQIGKHKKEPQDRGTISVAPRAINQVRNMKDKLPTNGLYNITFSKVSGSINISEIRIYAK